MKWSCSKGLWSEVHGDETITQIRSRSAAMSPCPKALCNQVEPSCWHEWLWIQAQLLSILIHDFNSCSLQLNCLVYHDSGTRVGMMTLPWCNWAVTVLFCSHLQWIFSQWCVCASGESNYALSILSLSNLTHFCKSWTCQCLRFCIFNGEFNIGFLLCMLCTSNGYPDIWYCFTSPEVQ